MPLGPQSKDFYSGQLWPVQPQMPVASLCVLSWSTAAHTLLIPDDLFTTSFTWIKSVLPSCSTFRCQEHSCIILASRLLQAMLLASSLLKVEGRVGHDPCCCSFPLALLD
jgi:hypothetical protein